MKGGIIVIGAEGHAKVIIELLRAMSETPVYCVAESEGPSECLGVPVLIGNDHLTSLRNEGYARAFVAIGANRNRQRMGNLAIEMGYRLANAISPVSHISSSARIGEGVAIMAGAVINADTLISDLAIINTGATIDHDCRIGRSAHVGPQCGLAGDVWVGDESFLGIGCKVIPGIRIGERATIGAGGIVISNIPAGAVAIGVPAKVKLNL